MSYLVEAGSKPPKKGILWHRCSNKNNLLPFQVAGILWRVNFLKIQTFIQVPKFVSKLFSSTLGRLLDTSEQVDQNLQTFGATLELQRQENLERLEQQLLMQSIRNSQNGRNIHIGRPQPQVNESRHEKT